MPFDPSTAVPAAGDTADTDHAAVDKWVVGQSPGISRNERLARVAGTVAAFKGGDAAGVLRQSVGLMPPAVRKGIKREFNRAAYAAQESATAGPKPDLGDFWAKNAAKILSGRFTGRGSWRAQAKDWLRGATDHVGRTVGVRADAPIVQALSATLGTTPATPPTPPAP